MATENRVTSHLEASSGSCWRSARCLGILEAWGPSGSTEPTRTQRGPGLASPRRAGQEPAQLLARADLGKGPPTYTDSCVSANSEAVSGIPRAEEGMVSYPKMLPAARSPGALRVWRGLQSRPGSLQEALQARPPEGKVHSARACSEKKTHLEISVLCFPFPGSAPTAGRRNKGLNAEQAP